MGKKSREKAARRERLQSVRDGRASAPSEDRTTPVRAPAPAARPGTLSTVYQQAWEHLQQGQAEEALRLLQRNPPPPGQEPVHRELTGHCLVALNAFDQAYKLLASLPERGMRPETQFALTQTEANLNLTVHAERRIKRLSQAYPTHPAMPNLREWMQNVRRDRETQARALGISPAEYDEAAYVFESAYLPFSQREYERTIELCRRAIEISPRFDPAYLTLASALAAKGEEEEAAAALEQAASSETSQGASAAFHLVQLYTALDRPEEARRVADRLLQQPTTPANRESKAEAMAALDQHEAIRTLLTGPRDLSPREHYLLGVANAQQGDLPGARREVRSAIQKGYQAPLAYWAMARLDASQPDDISYFTALEVAGPRADAAIRRAIESADDTSVEELRGLIERPRVQLALDLLLRQDPPAGIRTLAAVGTPEALDRLHELARDSEATLQDRLIALSFLRDRGEIAEDEPIDLEEAGETRTVVMGRHRILPDPPLELPSAEAARLYGEGAEMYSADPETAYLRWVELDEQHIQTPRIRTQIAALAQALGRFDEAREWLDGALDLNPESVDAHVGLAALALTTGDLRGALAQARAIDAAPSMPASTFLTYQSVREHLNTLIESPLADALLQQAEMTGDEETAEASREMAGLLGEMQKTLALTQYLRQRPIGALREELPLREVLEQMDPQVLENAAWLFGLLPEVEELQGQAQEEAVDSEGAQDAGEEAAGNEAGEEEEEGVLEEEPVSPAVLDLLGRELLLPDRLAEGLPGLNDRDLEGLQWLLGQGGVAPLEEFLAVFPVDEGAPSDMVLEYGLVVEGRLAGRMTRLIPMDLREPLREALQQVRIEEL